MITLEIELDHRKYIFKDKQQVFAFLDKNPTRLNELKEKYIDAKGYKNVKNMYQLAFNIFNKKDEDYCGKCIVCNNPTEFNLATKKYSRLDKKECIEKYKKQFKERMNKAYGRDYFTQDPEAQKKMLGGRSITNEYRIGNYTINYVGTWEKDFLDFCFHILKMHPTDLIECPYTIDYEIDNIKHFYIPDYYIPSLNLIVEIKGRTTDTGYQKRDEYMELAKKEAAIDYMKKKNGYYYILYDKEYRGFLNFLKTIIDKD